MTYTRAIGWVSGKIIDRIVRALALSRIHPNVLTFLGLVINTWAAFLFAAGSFRWAGVVVILAGLFDMVDGRVARETNRVTRFGGFFDSVLDRYSDLALFMGLLVYYASINRFFYIVLTAIVMTGSVMVSYTRARAEYTIPKCKVGFLERPERVVLIIIGALFDRMAPVLVGDRGALESHGDSPHDLHLAGSQAVGRSAIEGGAGNRDGAGDEGVESRRWRVGWRLACAELRSERCKVIGFCRSRHHTSSILPLREQPANVGKKTGHPPDYPTVFSGG